MSNIIKVRWSEVRDLRGLGIVCFQMLGELKPEGWEFSEQEAYESSWYPVTSSKELVTKAIAVLNKQHTVQGNVLCFIEPGAMVRMQNIMLDKRAEILITLEMLPAAA